MSQSDMPVIVPGIVRFKSGPSAGSVLLGGVCVDCKHRYFPQPIICPDCFGKVEQTELGSRGIIYSYTVVRTKPPLGLPRPYAVGYIDLEDSMLRVFSLFDPGQIDLLQIGRTVRLACGPLGEDGRGNTRVRPYFTIIDGGENT
jgi:uncharacterized OB-fold protein